MRFAGRQSPRRPLVCRCAGGYGWGGPPAARRNGGRVGAGGCGGGIGGSPDSGHHGIRFLVGERGGAIWKVRPLAVGTVGAWVLEVVAAVSVRRRFAVTAAAACLSVSGGVRFEWSARCPSARLARGGWRWWRRYGWSAGSR